MFKKQVEIVFRVVIGQLVLVCLLSVFFGLYKGQGAFLSAGLGGLMGVVPSLIFAVIFFKKKTVFSSHVILRSFYLGELIKLLFVGVLFTLAFHWKDVQVLPLFLVFIATQLVYWFILLKGQ